MKPIVADLRGLTCLVTGASAGIGKETARGLGRLGARVILGCRNAEKGARVRDELAQSAPGADFDLRVVDLAEQASIQRFAAEVRAAYPALHVLVNNAGVWLQKRETSAEGLERTWATNMLGYFFLTEALLPLLKASGPARIVSVASKLARGLDLSDVEFKRRSYSGVSAYSQSKQANRLWTWALARRLRGSALRANAIHPGGVQTELFAKAGGIASVAASGWARMFAKTPADGADSVLWAAASPEAAELHGAFIADRAVQECEFRGKGEEDVWSLCASMKIP